MKKLAAILAVASLFSLTSAHAADVSGDYVVGGRVDIEGCCSAGSQSNIADTGMGRGGYTFTLTQGGFDRIRIADNVTKFIGFRICQDGGDGICGQQAPGSDPDKTESMCATGGFQNLANSYGPGSVTVFIDVVNTACDEFATSGRITLRR